MTEKEAPPLTPDEQEALNQEQQRVNQSVDQFLQSMLSARISELVLENHRLKKEIEDRSKKTKGSTKAS